MSSRCFGVSLRRIHLYASFIGALPVMLSAASGMGYRLARSAGVEKMSIKWMLRVHTLEIIGLRSVYPVLLLSVCCVLIVTGMSLTSAWAWLRSYLSRRRSLSAGGGGSQSRSLNRAVEMYERRQQQLQQGGAAATAAASAAGLDTQSAAEESEWSETEDSLLSGSNGGVGGSGHRALPQRTLQQRLSSCMPTTFSWRCVHRTLGLAVFAPFALTALTGGMFIIAGDWMRLDRSSYWMLMYLHEGRYLERSGTVYVALLGSAVLALSVAGCAMLWARQCASLGGGGGGASVTPRHASSSSFSSSGSASSSITNESNAQADPSDSSSSAFVSPSAETRRTMARIHKAFLDDGQTTGGETEAEDELAAGTSDS